MAVSPYRPPTGNSGRQRPYRRTGTGSREQTYPKARLIYNSLSTNAGPQKGFWRYRKAKRIGPRRDRAASRRSGALWWPETRRPERLRPTACSRHAHKKQRGQGAGHIAVGVLETPVAGLEGDTPLMAQKALRDAPADPDPTRGPAASTSCTTALYRGQRFLGPWGGAGRAVAPWTWAAVTTGPTAGPRHTANQSWSGPR